MNGQLQDFARRTLKDSLSKLPEKWVHTFKIMYAYQNSGAGINDVVDIMTGLGHATGSTVPRKTGVIA